MCPTPSALAASLTAEVTRDALHLILSRTEITKVLSAIHAQRDPVSIWLPDEEDELGVANILHLDPVVGTLDLTYTNSKEMNKRLVRTRKFRCGGMYEGVHFEFVGSILRELAAGERSWLQAGFPDGLLFGQRRRHQRYHVPPQAGRFTIHIPLPGGGKIVAQVVDISLSGIGFVECELGTHIADGSELPGCTVAVPGSEPVAVTLRVRHVNERAEAQGARARQIGCEFVAPDDALRTLIKRFIVALRSD